MNPRQVVRLLLVEPHRPVHTAVERLIRRQKLPYVLETAASQREALSRLRHAPCDAVLLDCTAGSGRGWEIFEQAQRSPVILLVDRRCGDAALRAPRRGVCPCPVDTDDENSWKLLPAVVENAVVENAVVENRVDRKHRLAAPGQGETRFRAMADAAPLPLWTSGPDGLATFFNRSWLRFRGRRPEEELAQGWLEGVHPEDRQTVLRAGRVAVDARRECRLEYRLKRHDGRYRWILDRRTAHYLPDGTFAGHVCQAADISAQKRAEQEAHRRLGELAHMERLATISEMVFGLSHELNQPLGAITHYARACRYQAQTLDGENGKQVVDFLARIDEQADRAGRIIRSLRDFVRRADCRRAEVDVNELIRESTVLLEVPARSHDVRLELILDPALPRPKIDRTQIQQVIANLARNAIEAVAEMPQPRRIVTLRTSLRGQSEIAVAVEDKGAGLDEEDVERLFEPFYSRKADGMGLGLSISRSLVEAHGGRLEVQRGVEEGATLRFTLPLEGKGGQE